MIEECIVHLRIEPLHVGCIGKRRFTAFSEAEKAAKRQARRYDGERFSPYHCGHCNGFHVGEHLKRQRRPRIEA